MHKNAEDRIESLISQMTLEEKAGFVTGENFMETRSVPRLGIPSIKVADGPHGMRWGDKATCFPTGVGLAATWDTDLMERVGVALAAETRAKGRHIILGPCVNIHRTPLGGRNFESFGEDPYLAARMAVAYVKGVQSQGIGTSTKHFAVNNQEWERMTISVELDERALREIYLPAFRAAVEEADTWTVMSAYNRLRGDYCTANRHLLDILKKEWGFRGLVVSDWGATHDTEGPANAGMDLEMPGPGEYFGSRLVEAVKNGKVKEDALDDKVRRILRVTALLGLFDDNTGTTPPLNIAAQGKLAREAAAGGITLLKNKGRALPLKKESLKSIAVIGPNSAVARTGGGGSSWVTPYYRVSPLEAIRSRCGNAIVRHADGIVFDLHPVEPRFLVPEKDSSVHGLRGEYFNNRNLEGEPELVRIDPNIDFDWGAGSPSEKINDDDFSVRWTGKLTPEKSGSYVIGMSSDDGFRLYLDGKLLLDEWRDMSGITHSTKIELEAGREYDVRIEYFENKGAANAHFGWRYTKGALDEAVAAAAESEAVIVFAGISDKYEGEGTDRSSLDLPEGQDALIERIAETNPNTIVVLNNGTPLRVNRWLGKVQAVVEAWYPGQEGGNAIADVLFGDVNPSGKLPVTFPEELSDSPAHGTYPGANGKVDYSEGIYVGYRHFDTHNVAPLFPFGHGLSYTRFEYGDLAIARNGRKAKVSFNIKNVGDVPGAEVVQLYVRDIEASVDRPLKELKEFRKVMLQPGESRTVDLDLEESAFAFYSIEQNRWVAEPGQFEIMVGSSSRDIRLKGEFELRD